MAQNTKNIKHRKVSLEREKHHHVFLFVFLVLIVAAIVVYALVFLVPRGSNPSNPSSPEQDNSEPAQKPAQDNSSTSGDNSKESTSEARPESEKNNPQYEGNNPNVSESLTGIINYASISNDTLTIRVSIEQSVSGTCTFAITTPTGGTVTGQSTIVTGPTSAFCSFSTPATESGTWKISVTAASADKYGIITGEASN